MFRISLAQWSLHRTLRKGALDPLDFPKVVRQDYGLEAVEYERTDGPYEWEPPILTTAATLQRFGEHELRAELALPDATAAPASVECRWGSDTQGIRWLLHVGQIKPNVAARIRSQFPPDPTWVA